MIHGRQAIVGEGLGKRKKCFLRKEVMDKI